MLGKSPRETLSKRTRILIMLPNLGRGGAEQFLVALAESLIDEYDIRFAIASKRTEISPHPSIQVQSYGGLGSFIIGSLRIFWCWRPDFVLSSILDMNLLVLLLSRLSPEHTKFVVREALGMAEARKLGRYPRIYSRLAQQLYRRASRVVVLSDDLKRALLEEIPTIDANKVSVIPNGVPDSRFSSLPLPEPDPFLVVAIGRLADQKGFFELIQAFTYFREDNPDYRLAIVGEGPQRQALSQLITSLSQQEFISLMGNITNPIPILSRAAFYVLSSRFEGVSNAMLEALANGAPVLATLRDTSAGIFIDDTNGVLVETCSRSDLVLGLKEMKNRVTHFDRTSIALRARERFSISGVANQYRLMLDEMRHKATTERLR